MAHTMLENLESQFSKSIQASRFPDLLMDHFCHEIGPRPTGSPSMREASQYACQRLREIGADDVHTELVELSRWEDAPLVGQEPRSVAGQVHIGNVGLQQRA